MIKTIKEAFIKASSTREKKHVFFEKLHLLSKYVHIFLNACFLSLVTRDF